MDTNPVCEATAAGTMGRLPIRSRARTRGMAGPLLAASLSACLGGCAGTGPLGGGVEPAARPLERGDGPRTGPGGSGARLPLPPVVLTNQWGETLDLAALRGRTALLVIGDRWTGDACGAWSRELSSALSGFQPRLRILDLRGVPGLLHAYALSRIRKEMRPQDEPLFVDWDGRVTAYYGIPAREPTVLVLGPGGEVLARETGPVQPAKVARVRAAIEGHAP